ncbi:hypothetical protein J21TS7_58360 [Paenibacillus cineris]|uniref:Uncharacterized protein n=1 Tax=Paenibacillus cineris TaxID=237530 RepID=A0ABQ4LLX5_9BACL|nr:hypothetical protein J21TS7_58360 [Paenibacillus cineris]GIO63280.1 hypothetical protein J43TS9_48540 [Paenibacillus cineris]
MEVQARPGYNSFFILNLKKESLNEKENKNIYNVNCDFAASGRRGLSLPQAARSHGL